MLEHPGALPRVTWPRTAALLARQALEGAVEEPRRRPRPGLEACSRATQFHCLPFYADPDTARHASQTWAALSRACHHHAYELAPTATELRAWLEEVDRVIASLEGA